MYIFAQKCLCIENNLYLCTAKMVECATVFAVELIKTDRNGYSMDVRGLSLAIPKGMGGTEIIEL